jgi:hypothetical protein
MTEQPVNSRPEGQDDLTMSQYRNQKLALEGASRQLRFKHVWPKISIIRPGGVATQDNLNNTNKANAYVWVKSIIDTFTHNDNIMVSEISVEYTNKRIAI